MEDYAEFIYSMEEAVIEDIDVASGKATSTTAKPAKATAVVEDEEEEACLETYYGVLLCVHVPSGGSLSWSGIASAAGLSSVGKTTAKIGQDVAGATSHWWGKTTEWFATEMEEVQPLMPTEAGSVPVGGPASTPQQPLSPLDSLSAAAEPASPTLQPLGGDDWEKVGQLGMRVLSSADTGVQHVRRMFVTSIPMSFGFGLFQQPPPPPPKRKKGKKGKKGSKKGSKARAAAAAGGQRAMMAPVLRLRVRPEQLIAYMAMRQHQQIRMMQIAAAVAQTESDLQQSNVQAAVLLGILSL